VQVMLQGCAKDPQAYGHDDQRWDPETVQPKFGLPCPSPTSAKPEWYEIVQKVAPCLGCENAKPQGECD